MDSTPIHFGFHFKLFGLVFEVTIRVGWGQPPADTVPVAVPASIEVK